MPSLTIRTIGRVVGAALIATLAGAASAQDRCESPYTVEPGDTLTAIAERCGTSVDAILSANPAIADPATIAVGARIDIPAGGVTAETGPAETADDAQGQRTGTGPMTGDGAPRTTGERAGETAEPAAGRQVTTRPGDTLETVAERVGTTAAALAAANPGMATGELTAGETITIPAGLPGARTVTARPPRAAPGTPVTLTARGFLPGASVVIGGGPTLGEWQRLASARVGPDGTVETDVRVPQDYAPGRAIVFVVEGPLGDTARSGAVMVVEGEPAVAGPGTDDAAEAPAAREPASESPAAGERAAADESAMRTLEGELSTGVECPVLTTDDGTVYSLTGDVAGFGPGDRVRVRGPVAGISFCMQGEDTIEVRSIEAAP